jgi:hypothetical protein
MNDPILISWLEQQALEAEELDRESDVVNISPIGSTPYQRYVVEYHCKGLVKTVRGVEEANRFAVGFYFPTDYWHRVHPAEVVTLLWPVNLWHSNSRFPYICVGRLLPGTGLIDLITQVYSILTFNNITIREDDALQPEVSAWARRNMHRFPLENRPLRRRKINLRVSDAPTQGTNDGREPHGDRATRTHSEEKREADG